MTRTIHKYPIKITEEQEILLAHGAIIRHFGFQDGKPFIWVEFRPEWKAEHGNTIVRLYVVGTGEHIPRDAEHFIGTALAGRFVWHLYSNKRMKEQ